MRRRGSSASGRSGLTCRGRRIAPRGAGDAVPEQGEQDAVHVELLSEMADVGADGGLGEVKASGDRAVAAAVTEGGEDVDLAGRWMLACGCAMGNPGRDRWRIGG